MHGWIDGWVGRGTDRHYEYIDIIYMYNSLSNFQYLPFPSLPSLSLDACVYINIYMNIHMDIHVSVYLYVRICTFVLSELLSQSLYLFTLYKFI